MRKRIPLNVTPAVTGVIKCVPLCQIRSTMSWLEEARASCGNAPNALQRGPMVAENTPAEPKLNSMIIKLFQDMVARMENIEKVCSQKSIDEQIEEAVERKMVEVYEEAKERIKESKTLS